MVLAPASAGGSDYNISDIDLMVDIRRENQLRFERDFEGRTIEVDGIFRGLNTHVIGSTLWAKFDIAGVRANVHCVYLNRSSPAATTLVDASPGDRFTILGQISRTFLGDLQVRNCEILNETSGEVEDSSLQGSPNNSAVPNWQEVLELIARCESALETGEGIEEYANRLSRLQGFDFQSYPTQKSIALRCLRRHFGEFYYYDSQTLSFISRSERAERLQGAEDTEELGQERTDIDLSGERAQAPEDALAVDAAEFLEEYDSRLFDACFAVLESDPLRALTNLACYNRVFQPYGFEREGE